MDIEISNKNFSLNIYGFSGTAINNDYTGTAFRLMDKMWQIVKANGLTHKGINIWVYEANEKGFTGVELIDHPKDETGLERKNIHLKKYARYKHIGPYNKITQAGQNMKNELRAKGWEIVLPYIEIYGHWTHDENKSETELIMCLK